MPIVSLDTLKGYFDDGDVPNGAEYVDLIDTLSINSGTAISEFLSLIGLRGFWPMGPMNETPLTLDISSNSRNLTKAGAGASVSYDDNVAKFIPYSNFYASQFLYRNDEAGLDITGTETSVHSSMRGLTIGCWVRIPSTAPAADTGIIGKYYTTGNQKSYLLYRRYSTNKYNFVISNDGTTGVQIESSLTLSEAGGWSFIVGKFDPITEVSIFHNGYWYKNTTSIPSSIFVSTARLEIGSFNNGLTSTTWTHNGALYFLTASALTSLQIEHLYAITKPMFMF